MDLFEAFEKRHSVRSFSPEPVPKELIDKLIYAASLAPSSLNEQPWRFYVVRGESRTKLGQIMAQSTSYLEEYLKILGKEMDDHVVQWYSELGGAPVVMACTMPRVEDDFARLNKHIAAGAALEHILLAATDLGLGACMVTFSFWVRDDIGRELGIPDERAIVALVVLGYPSDEPPLVPPKRHDVGVYLD
ncbi:MAG: nitroreductase [Actinomycetota bacterium]|nr:nitroreductase [Actinomycetota bacterium]